MNFPLKAWGAIVWAGVNLGVRLPCHWAEANNTKQWEPPHLLSGTAFCDIPSGNSTNTQQVRPPAARGCTVRADSGSEMGVATVRFGDPRCRGFTSRSGGGKWFRGWGPDSRGGGWKKLMGNLEKYPPQISSPPGFRFGGGSKPLGGGSYVEGASYLGRKIFFLGGLYDLWQPVAEVK